MSKRTFIPKWGSFRKPPVVFRRRKSVHGLVYRSPQPKVLNPESDDGRVRWYSNTAAQGSKQEARVTRERLTQRVGLFRNAKHSQVVINDISNAVRRACHKQINRLVASDGTHGCSPADDDNQPVQTIAGIVERQPQDESSAHVYCGDVDDYELAPTEHFTNNQRNYVMRGDDSGYEPQASYGRIALQRECHRIDSSCSRVDGREYASKKERHSVLKKRTSEEYDAYSDSRQDEDNHINQRRQNIASKAAEKQLKMMQTPKSSHLPKSGDTSRPSNVLSLPLVSARILSALPPIYLRDDQHDKYDATAVRLLSESIMRSETEPRLTNSIFRSFLDRTGSIAVEEARSQPNDNECENIFQNYSDFDVIAGEIQDTPELEKLFNQTVGASKLDDYPEFLLHIKSKSSKLASVSRQTSSLMTPASLGSRRPATSSLPTEKVGKVKDCTILLPYNFPFSRSSSSSNSSSPSDDINFEWTIPKAEKD